MTAARLASSQRRARPVESRIPAGGVVVAADSSTIGSSSALPSGRGSPLSVVPEALRQAERAPSFSGPKRKVEQVSGLRATRAQPSKR